MHLIHYLNSVPLSQLLEKVVVASVGRVELSTVKVDASKRDSGLDVALVVVGVVNKVEGVRNVVAERISHV